MPKADTPAPKEGEEVTPPEGTDTPVDEPKGEPASPNPSEGEKTVTELEGEVVTLKNEVEKQKTIAKTAQRKERIEALERGKVETTLKKIRSGEISADEEIPEDEAPTEKETRQQARIKVQNLIIGSPEYQGLIKDNVTLREVIKNNPLALIGDYLDSDDAVEQIKEKLDDLVSSKSEQPNEETEEEKDKGKEFEAGAPQPKETPAEAPKTEGPPQDKTEESIKNRITVG